MSGRKKPGPTEIDAHIKRLRQALLGAARLEASGRRTEAYARLRETHSLWKGCLMWYERNAPSIVDDVLNDGIRTED